MATPDPTDVDRFLELLLDDDERALADAVQRNADAGLPAIDVSPMQGKLLHLLVRLSGARRILEIGTLGGYSAIWMARGLGDDGRLVTLEVDPRWAEVAAENIDRAGVGDRVSIEVGAALETLPTLPRDEPFDLVFIDADKQTYPRYLEAALDLTRPGSLIVADNVIREGTVVDPPAGDQNALGAHELLEIMGADPRLDATAIQTLGSKRWDGLAFAIVR